MTATPPPLSPHMLLGYARASAMAPPLEAQVDSLAALGVERRRIYTDVAAAGSVVAQRPGFDALLDYARPGDLLIVVSMDRLGRSLDEVMSTVRTLTDHDVGIHAVREGLSTHDDAGSTLVGVLASLAVVNEEAGASTPRARAPGDRHRTGHLGRPRALTDEQVELARRLRDNGDSVPTIAAVLGVSRATLYRTLAEKRSTR
ncbi:recombinase family protein [Gordonia aichiensis]|uniref:Putative site-specific recombinase n=1 Tax=Gordonia aichiensis NBRC 108223 TaxID=1220583 RepID=L7KKK1_9ACTN|nr:recombinase family protein [Gordonia aichiensis]GAC48253.1 putative site-specific recombinase [Gordonia aichiensis NBRC 108223]